MYLASGARAATEGALLHDTRAEVRAFVPDACRQNRHPGTGVVRRGRRWIGLWRAKSAGYGNSAPASRSRDAHCGEWRFYAGRFSQTAEESRRDAEHDRVADSRLQRERLYRLPI